MKTLLHFSVALMLIAGTAGTIDFLKMFKSGELDKIYTHEQPLHIASVAHHAAIETPTTVFQKVQQKWEEVNFEPEYYSRAPLEERQVYAETAYKPQQGKSTTALSENKVEEKVQFAEVPFIQMVNEIQSKHTEADMENTPLAKNGSKKKKFKLSMYSRAYIPEEEFEIVLENEPAPADSSAQSLFEY
ncbi:MAG: hypothetical protein KIS94_04445 [Chitinophagales bacterium]|nr:hypothetical protein [Chitinophagales bacterium]